MNRSGPLAPDQAPRRTAPAPGFGRGKSFGLYLAAAVAFALCMFLIGLIPGHEGGGRAIRYESFGPLCVVLIGLFLFDPSGGLLRDFHLPDPFYGSAFILIAVVYSLLVTLPTYFYLRTRLSWFLGVQALALVGHSLFALRVVARFWINQ